MIGETFTIETVFLCTEVSNIEFWVGDKFSKFFFKINYLIINKTDVPFIGHCSKSVGLPRHGSN